MKLVHYKELQEHPAELNARSGHVGLFFDRFWPTETDPEIPKSTSGAEWEKFKSRIATFDDSLIKSTVLRLAAFQGRYECYTCSGRFLTGSGLPHPSENGFLWHPTLGTPYLPGAAVKGIVRSAIELYLEDDGSKAELLQSWFGSESKEPDSEHGTGGFIFYDALPVSEVALKVEVMTPHMGKWYAEGSNAKNYDQQPGDWHTPIPISYLTATNISLMFAIQPRGKEFAEKLGQVFEALAHGLEFVGAGAKTAIGFGSFTRDENKDKSLQVEAEKWQQALNTSLMSPNQQAVVRMKKYLDSVPSAQRTPGGGVAKLVSEVNVLIDQLKRDNDSAVLALLKDDIEARRVKTHPYALELPSKMKKPFNWE